MAPGFGNSGLEKARPPAWLEAASLLEAATLVALVFGAVPLKHFAHYEMAVSVMGPVHGMAFVGYALLALRTAAERGWPSDVSRRLLLNACIPFAGFTTPGYLRSRLEKASAL